MDLEKLIVKVKNLRDQKSLIEKDLKKVEPELKQELEGLGITKKQFPNSKLKLSYVTVHKSSMNSDKLLAIIKNLVITKTDFSKDIEECIEYKPYLNNKILHMMYLTLNRSVAEKRFLDKSPVGLSIANDELMKRLKTSNMF